MKVTILPVCFVNSDGFSVDRPKPGIYNRSITIQISDLTASLVVAPHELGPRIYEGAVNCRFEAIDWGSSVSNSSPRPSVRTGAPPLASAGGKIL